MAIELDRRPPDIVLLVEESWQAGERLRLRYQLQHGGDSFSGGFETETFAARDRQLATFRSAVDSVREPISARDAKRRVLGAARLLTDRLVPHPVVSLLDGLRGRAASLLIITDACWIPFEAFLIAGTGNEPQEVPWCRAFALTRWLPKIQLDQALPMHSLGVILGTGSRLLNLEHERNRLRAVSKTETTYLPRVDVALEALDSGRFDIFHFAGHAEVKGEREDLWKLEIEPGCSITRADIGGLGPGFRARRPFVFLNACSSSRSGEAWGQPSGIAASFIEAGAGAVIGASWPVTDALATEFAAALYPALRHGRPLGEAVRDARECLRALAPDDPTWLAYSIYGHPLARMVDSVAVDTDEVDSHPSGELPPTAARTGGTRVQSPAAFLERRSSQPIPKRWTQLALLVLLLTVVGVLALADRRADRTPDATYPGAHPDKVQTENTENPAAEEDARSAQASNPGLALTAAIRNQEKPVDTERSSLFGAPSEDGTEISDETLGPETQTARSTDIPTEIEVRAGPFIRVEMVPANLSVRFEEKGGVHIYTLTAHGGEDGPVRKTYFANSASRSPLRVNTSSGKWRFDINAVDLEGKLISVIVSKELS